MAVERYGSKTDIVVKLILVFFISLLSFSIGTFVGKKFSDNQHKVAQLEPSSLSPEEENAREVASVHPDAGEVKPKDALTDEEIKKLAEEFVSDDTHKPAAAADPHAKPAVEEHKTDKNSEHHEVAKTEKGKTDKLEVTERVVAGKPPEDAKKEEASKSRIPQSLPKEVAASATGKFTVQVGSYPDETEAQKIASDLKDKGFSAFYVSATVKGKTYYRVGVGLFATQKEADAYKKDLLSRAKVTSAFVQKL